MVVNGIKKTPKNAGSFECKSCDFKCCKLSDWNRHIMRPKHINSIKKTPQILDNFVCECGNIYKFKSGLYRHKPKCLKTQKNAQEPSVTDLVTKLINQNSELQQMLIEQNNKMFELVKEAKCITNNNTTNNNTFNLNVFLNEKCKDAVNLVDFVDSLEVQLSDLEETSQLGYTEGVSRIIINGLNELDVFKRPIHCSDLKRETLYIKDQDEWTKEDSDKTHLSKAIKVVSKKNVQQIFEWQKKYPDYNDPESKQSDRYMEMICNTMNASTAQEQEKNMNKIIKNITKEVVIDKNI
jgi:hypothetical protein